MRIPPSILEKMAKCYKDAIINEALKDFAKRGWSVIAQDKDLHLKNSFTITVDFNGVNLYCSFPMIKLWLEGMERQKMDWVPRGVPIPIENDKGEIIFRMLPLKTSKVWIHPGIEKFAFLKRALGKGKLDSDKILAEYVLNHVLSTYGDSN